MRCPRSEWRGKESGQSSIPGVIWGLAAAAWVCRLCDRPGLLQHVAQEPLLHRQCSWLAGVKPRVWGLVVILPRRQNSR